MLNDLRNQSKDAAKDTISRALFSKDYRYATWLCMGLAFFFQMSGMNIVSIYSTTIFEDLEKVTTSPLSVKTDNYFIGFAGVFGALTSPLPFKYLSMRAVFLGGHTVMGMLLFAAYLFIQAD